MLRRVGVAVAGLVLIVGCGSDGDQSATIAEADESVATAEPTPSSTDDASSRDDDSSEASDPDSPVANTTDASEGTEQDRNEPKGGKATGPKKKSKPKKSPAGRYSVLEVVDGDTVKVAYNGGVSVRVIGIDTPETVHPSQPDECWGQAASAAAHRLLDGKKVNLVFDASQGRTDVYDRTLAYIEIPGAGDFGLIMLQRGHAAEYTYDTAYDRQAEYRAAESRAQSANKAMWRHCGGPDVPLQKPTPTPTPEPAPQPAGNCAPGYDPCVPPYPPDVDCADVDGPIRVSGDDLHGLDGEGDGIACE